MPTSRPLDLLDAGIALFERHLRTVEDPRWSAPTPCAGWTVLDLANHVVGGNRLAVAVLSGRAPGPSAAVPAEAIPEEFRRSAADLCDAFRHTDPDALVAHPAGEVRAADFTVYRAGDVAVHAWDLARALGADDDLGPALVDEVLDPYVRWVETLDVDGMYAAPAPAGPSPSRQDRLLARLGRTP